MGHIDNYDPALDCFGKDPGQRAVRSFRGVSRAEGFQYQSLEPRNSEHGIDHLRLDAGEHSETGHMIDGLVGLDAEWSDMRRPVDQLPRDVGLQARDGR